MLTVLLIRFVWFLFHINETLLLNIKIILNQFSFSILILQIQNVLIFPDFFFLFFRIFSSSVTNLFSNIFPYNRQHKNPSRSGVGNPLLFHPSVLALCGFKKNVISFWLNNCIKNLAFAECISEDNLFLALLSINFWKL